MVAHFGFLVFLVVGGFLAWRWRCVFWVHLAAAAWGAGTVAFGFPCPLTDLENWGRAEAGQETLASSGFIDHYLTGFVYPAEHLRLIQAMVAVVVVCSWAWLAVLVTRDRRRRTS